MNNESSQLKVSYKELYDILAERNNNYMSQKERDYLHSLLGDLLLLHRKLQMLSSNEGNK